MLLWKKQKNIKSRWKIRRPVKRLTICTYLVVWQPYPLSFENTQRLNEADSHKFQQDFVVIHFTHIELLHSFFFIITEFIIIDWYSLRKCTCLDGIVRRSAVRQRKPRLKENDMWRRRFFFVRIYFKIVSFFWLILNSYGYVIN